MQPRLFFLCCCQKRQPDFFFSFFLRTTRLRGSLPVYLEKRISSLSFRERRYSLSLLPISKEMEVAIVLFFFFPGDAPDFRVFINSSLKKCKFTGLFPPVATNDRKRVLFLHPGEEEMIASFLSRMECQPVLFFFLVVFFFPVERRRRWPFLPCNKAPQLSSLAKLTRTAAFSFFGDSRFRPILFFHLHGAASSFANRGPTSVAAPRPSDRPFCFSVHGFHHRPLSSPDVRRSPPRPRRWSEPDAHLYDKRAGAPPLSGLGRRSFFDPTR